MPNGVKSTASPYRRKWSPARPASYTATRQPRAAPRSAASRPIGPAPMTARRRGPAPARAWIPARSLGVCITTSPRHGPPHSRRPLLQPGTAVAIRFQQCLLRDEIGERDDRLARTEQPGDRRLVHAPDQLASRSQERRVRVLELRPRLVHTSRDPEPHDPREHGRDRLELPEKRILAPER